MIDTRFVFIIPAYNAADWYHINLKSILIQSYTNWRIVYIDDCSQDNTLNLVKSFLKDAGLLSKVTFIQNQTNLGPAASRYYGYQKTDDDEICCMLDGDDWLFGNRVLEQLIPVYEKHNATYGSYALFTNGQISSGWINPNQNINCVSSKNYRKENPWFAKHLRTMKSYLIKDIPLDHIQIDHEWIRCCSDVAESYYIMEKPETKALHIKNLFYVYNKDNSIRYPLSSYRKTENLDYKKKVFNYIINK
jgi:glycosyltransferase involved in cell wall biosynthesis